MAAVSGGCVGVGADIGLSWRVYISVGVMENHGAQAILKRTPGVVVLHVDAKCDFVERKQQAQGPDVLASTGRWTCLQEGAGLNKGEEPSGNTVPE